MSGRARRWVCLRTALRATDDPDVKDGIDHASGTWWHVWDEWGAPYGDAPEAVRSGSADRQPVRRAEMSREPSPRHHGTPARRRRTADAYRWLARGRGPSAFLLRGCCGHSLHSVVVSVSGEERLAAASRSRSRRRKRGPLACRCSTFTWCRSTKSSMSLWSCGRRPVPRTRRTRKWRSENSIDSFRWRRPNATGRSATGESKMT